MSEKIFDRNAVVRLLQSWVGLNEQNGTHKMIIDIYNSFSGPLPRGIKMQYSWAWCACTWSAAAIKLGYTEIMPLEISCGYLIENAKKMGIWVENDGFVPQPGDAILYDWDDNGVGDNTGWPEHVGTVETVNREAGYFTVIEGNYSDSVKKRTMSINGKFIRGFITPKYSDPSETEVEVKGPDKDVKTLAMEVIAGIWGNGEARKNALESYGYNYAEVQAEINRILNTPKPITPSETNKTINTTCYARNYSSSLPGIYVTTADLYCRNDAGSNKKALCIIPKGTPVNNYGYYNESDGVKWLLVQFTLNGFTYTGFSSIRYMMKK